MGIGPEMDKALAEVVRELAPDTLPKLRKCLGTSLDIISDVLVGAKFICCDSVRYVFLRVAKRLESVRPGEVVSVVPEIGCEILLRLPILSSSELLEFYSELLAKASINTEVDKVHPGFMETLKNLSLDEVKIVDFLLKNSRRTFPFVMPMFPSKTGPTSLLGHELQWYPDEFDGTLALVGNITFYLNNMENLGLLCRKEEMYRGSDESLLEEIKQNLKNDICNGRYDTHKESHLPEKVQFKEGFFQVTPFGEGFLSSLRRS